MSYNTYNGLEALILKMKNNFDNFLASIKDLNLDMLLLRSGDPHSTEFYHPRFEIIRFLTGFSGENATLLIELNCGNNNTTLWTDSRFELQAKGELQGSGINIKIQSQEALGSPKGYIKELATNKFKGAKLRLGIAYNYCSIEWINTILDKNININIVPVNLDKILDVVWASRPRLSQEPLKTIPTDIAGVSAWDKIELIRVKMQEFGIDYILVSDLAEIAWLLNLRGNDIPYSRLFYGYVLIGKSETWLFSDSIIPNISDKLSLNIKPYESIKGFLADLGKDTRLEYDARSLNMEIYEIVKGLGGFGHKRCVDIEMLKAAKTPAEIKSSKNCHIKDGIAMLEFLYFLQTLDYSKQLTEYELSTILNKLRQEQGAICPSFASIVAYRENGAIVHYEPKQNNSKIIKASGLLLVDSGGQYVDGTTDITRTIALGEPSQHERSIYTYVLKAHLLMMRAAIDKTTPAKTIDNSVRKELAKYGYSFGHGLGHGVGHLSLVHEGPNVFASSKENKLIENMIITDEPGIYLENDLGVRIENELITKLSNGKFSFEPITYCPYDRHLIDPKLLEEIEIAQIDDYHILVYDTLAPNIKEERLAFLTELCKPL